MATRTIPATALDVGHTIRDDRYFHDMVVGHVVIGTKWVTARAYHPETNIFPKTAYRFSVGDTVTIREEV